MTATPALFRSEMVLAEKSAVGTAPLMLEIAPLWQASRMATVSVLGRASRASRSASRGSSPAAKLSERARAWPE
jgi:hypothetical protein